MSTTDKRVDQDSEVEGPGEGLPDEFYLIPPDDEGEEPWIARPLTARGLTRLARLMSGFLMSAAVSLKGFKFTDEEGQVDIQVIMAFLSFMDERLLLELLAIVTDTPSKVLEEKWLAGPAMRALFRWVEINELPALLGEALAVAQRLGVTTKVSPDG